VRDGFSARARVRLLEPRVDPAMSTLSGGGRESMVKVVYDRDLTEWRAKYKKNKQFLGDVSAQCETLRQEVAKAQTELATAEAEYANMDNEMTTKLAVRLTEAQQQFRDLKLGKGNVEQQLSEGRKLNRALKKKRDAMASDYDKRYMDLNKLLEQRGRMENQLNSLNAQLQRINGEKRGLEKELQDVEADLQNNTDRVENLRASMRSVRDGVHDSVALHLQTPSKFDHEHTSSVMSYDRRA